MTHLAFFIRWTLLCLAGGVWIFAMLAHLDAQLAQQAVERQEDFSAYRTANGGAE